MNGICSYLWRKIFITVLLIIVFIGVYCSHGHCGWLIYHKPEFKGKVIDINTKAPIDGAVVVVIYRKRTMGLGAGTFSSIIEIKETLTDVNGKFRFPAYTTMIQPFSWETEASFIIYKPGYAGFDEIGPEDIFSGKETNDYEFPSYRDTKFKIRLLRSGVVEIPRVITKEDRINTSMSPVEDSEHRSSWYYEKQKMFIKAIRNEWQFIFGKDPSKLYKWEGDKQQ